MASGYIAGGAIAGIGIAFSAGVLGNFDDITKLMKASTRSSAGPTRTCCPAAVRGADGAAVPGRARR